MKITWWGHAAIQIEGSKIVIIDPFLTGNPVAAISPDKINQADLVAVTHDHGDHLGDALPFVSRQGRLWWPSTKSLLWQKKRE